MTIKGVFLRTVFDVLVSCMCAVFLVKSCCVFAVVEHSTWLWACWAWLLAQLNSVPCT